jgi:hypothetical protein
MPEYETPVYGKGIRGWKSQSEGKCSNSRSNLAFMSGESGQDKRMIVLSAKGRLLQVLPRGKCGVGRWRANWRNEAKQELGTMVGWRERKSGGCCLRSGLGKEQK